MTRHTASAPADTAHLHPRDANWWRQAVVYQIYPRSFADSNADGLGDLRGVTSRVSYLASLGIDAVWLSPFYPSSFHDGGYDVDDYRDVDPRLGTLDDFDEMLTTLHGAGIRVVVDIVPNHTSIHHEWFRAALAAGPGSPERELYHFHRGAGGDGSEPPSDWMSVFGGPAWERAPDEEWYLHVFAPEQPDLNWDNPAVHADFLRTLRFWADRGVDGFRVDVAHALTKDMSEPFKAAASEQTDLDGSHPWWDRDEVHQIYREWREVFDEYDPPRTAVAEAWVSPIRRVRYAMPDGLGQSFNFDLLEAPWQPESFRQRITENLELAYENGGSTTWVLSNHDVIRHASRYGLPASDRQDIGAGWLMSGGTAPVLDRAAGLRRARAGTLLVLALPGSVYLYQGEELGLHEVADLPHEALQDPTWLRTARTVKGRDGCRVPLPWTSTGPSYGFGTNGAHLPQPAWFADISVEAQETDPTSTLTLYRTALQLRRRLHGSDDLEWVDNGEETLHFVSPGGWHCLTNFGSEPLTMPAGDLLVTSSPLTRGLLPPDTTAWVLAERRSH